MVRLRTLGTLDLRRSDGMELRSVVAQPRRLALLAYLAVASPRGFHRRDELIGLFWAEQEEDRARASLSRACYFLRREIGEDVLVSRGGELGLNSDRLWCDTAALEQAVAAGQHREALELYRGDLLPGFFASRAPAFDAWLENERIRVRDCAASAAWTLAEQEEAAGNLSVAAHWARRGVELEPFGETGFRRLLALLDRSGDRSGAAHAYERFATQIATELELSPSPETQRLIEAIRTREIAREEQRLSRPNDSVVARDEALAPNDPMVPRHDSTAARPVDAPRIDVAPMPVAAPAARPHRPAQRRRRLTLAAIALAAMVLGAAAAGAARARGEVVDGTEVAIEPFANETHDRSLAVLSDEAIALISSSLTQTGVARKVTRLEPGLRGRSRRLTRSLAARLTGVPLTRPAVTVSGFATRAGDSATFIVRFSDRRRTDLQWETTPVRVAMQSPSAALEEIRQRTLGGVAALGDERLRDYLPVATRPPTFDAYQQLVEGTALTGRGALEAGMERYRWAAALDSTFTWPLLSGTVSHLWRLNGNGVDSTLRALSSRRRHLVPLQQHLLDYLLALRVEDWNASHRAIRAAAEILPQRYGYRHAIAATHLNRPREAVAALTHPGMDSVFKDGVQTYWLVLTLALHQLDEHRNELEAARRARNNKPQSASALTQELRALAAIGRVEALRARLDTVQLLPNESWFTPAQAMVMAGQELRAHGQPNASTEAFDRAIAWYRARPTDESSSEVRRVDLGFALYFAERWDEAESMFRTLVAQRPDVPEYLGPLGTIAARRGDRKSAERIAERLRGIEHPAPAPGQESVVWRARIAALLGDREGSMRLLTDAFGPHGTASLHGDIDFYPLRDYPPFREFVRPKG